MKNQNDLIVTIVTAFLAVVAIAAFYFTKPQPQQPPAVAPVVTAKPTLPTSDVQMATSLPGASNQQGGGGGGRAAGPGGAGPGGLAAPTKAGVGGGSPTGR